MMKQKLFAISKALVIISIMFFLLFLSINFYLQKSPLPELQYISNDRWHFNYGCSPFIVSGKEKNSLRCVLRLRSHSNFKVTNNTSYVVEWCNQEALETMKSDWDINWNFILFNYRHSVPMWSEGCTEEVIIETDIHLQAIRE